MSKRARESSPGTKAPIHKRAKDRWFYLEDCTGCPCHYQGSKGNDDAISTLLDASEYVHRQEWPKELAAPSLQDCLCTIQRLGHEAPLDVQESMYSLRRLSKQMRRIDNLWRRAKENVVGWAVKMDSASLSSSPPCSSATYPSSSDEEPCSYIV